MISQDRIESNDGCGETKTATTAISFDPCVRNNQIQRMIERTYIHAEKKKKKKYRWQWNMISIYTIYQSCVRPQNINHRSLCQNDCGVFLLTPERSFSSAAASESLMHATRSAGTGHICISFIILYILYIYIIQYIYYIMEMGDGSEKKRY